MPDPPGEGELPALLPEHVRRADEGDDAIFYSAPRFVTHIDDGAIAALTGLYRQAIPAGAAVLDLMSSWVSHLPPEARYARVSGLGMNAEELAANPRLDDWCVHDLNEDPALPYDDASFDAVTIAVSVQYLVRPVDVFREVARVLSSRGRVIVSYSNRCFPTKAVAVWQALGEREHADLIAYYLRQAGGFGPPQAIDLRPDRAPGEDPLYAVVAHRDNLGDGW